MRSMRTLYLLCLTLVIGCSDSKWDKIKGSGIDKESKSLDPIYFQDPDNGVVGGYTLINGNSPASSGDSTRSHSYTLRKTVDKFGIKSTWAPIQGGELQTFI